MWRQQVIAFNNAWVRRRGVRVQPGELLLLLPHCLHRQGCACDVGASLEACARCGRCDMASLARLRAEFGCIACVVGGGRQALALTRQRQVRAVVAVACERELLQGILLAWPKPVLAVINATPDGACRNTRVDPERVAAAITSLLAPPTRSGA